ncbi:MAG: hypothetical protein P8X55_19470 [Desulfosarcinaceae bacterium]
MYKALLSSDWNQCLAPCGPFDAFRHHYPDRAEDLDTVFRLYTGNAISLGEAAGRIRDLLPQGLTLRQMDDYLDQAFGTYPGVAELITWCRENNVLFMVNTTGLIGYFQRVLARGLLPQIPVLAAHPLIRFGPLASDPAQILVLEETPDKAVHTAAIAARYRIAPRRIFIMGDSGGDGPHFEWGARAGAHLIGSMTKPSLQTYCAGKGIEIGNFVGHTYARNEAVSPDREMAYNFLGIRNFIEPFIN